MRGQSLRYENTLIFIRIAIIINNLEVLRDIDSTL